MPGGVPYEIQPVGDLSVAGGVPQSFAIGFPSRSSINKIVVVQTAGVATDFTAALYNNASAAAGQNESESLPGGAVLTFPPDLYRVTPDLPGTAGRLVYFSELSSGGAGFSFFNLDHPASQPGLIGNPRTIYLRIAADQDATFAVVLGGDAYN